MTENFNTNSNFDHICRLCVQEKLDLQPIFDSSSIPDLIKACVDVEVLPADCLPKNVCGSCLEKMIDWKSFKSTCQESEEFLLDQVKNDESSNSNNEPLQMPDGQEAALSLMKEEVLSDESADENSQHVLESRSENSLSPVIRVTGLEVFKILIDSQLISADRNLYKSVDGEDYFACAEKYVTQRENNMFVEVEKDILSPVQFVIDGKSISPADGIKDKLNFTLETEFKNVLEHSGKKLEKNIEQPIITSQLIIQDSQAYSDENISYSEIKEVNLSSVHSSSTIILSTNDLDEVVFPDSFQKSVKMKKEDSNPANSHPSSNICQNDDLKEALMFHKYAKPVSEKVVKFVLPEDDLKNMNEPIAFFPSPEIILATEDVEKQNCEPTEIKPRQSRRKEMKPIKIREEFKPPKIKPKQTKFKAIRPKETKFKDIRPKIVSEPLIFFSTPGLLSAVKKPDVQSVPGKKSHLKKKPVTNKHIPPIKPQVPLNPPEITQQSTIEASEPLDSDDISVRIQKIIENNEAVLQKSKVQLRTNPPPPVLDNPITNMTQLEDSIKEQRKTHKQKMKKRDRVELQKRKKSNSVKKIANLLTSSINDELQKCTNPNELVIETVKYTINEEGLKVPIIFVNTAVDAAKNDAPSPVPTNILPNKRAWKKTAVKKRIMDPVLLPKNNQRNKILQKFYLPKEPMLINETTDPEMEVEVSLDEACIQNSEQEKPILRVLLENAENDQNNAGSKENDHEYYKVRSKRIRKRPVLKRKKKRKPKIYECNICETAFVKFYELLGHDRLVHPDVPCNEVCSFCGKSYISEARVKWHCNIYHAEKNVFCDLCGHGFSTLERLKNHLRSHNDKFICKECGFRASSKGKLAEHIRIHTGDKPFICEVCGAQLCSKFSLRQHSKKHNGEQRQLWSCKDCGYSTRCMTSFYNHRLIHRTSDSLLCEICGKSVLTKSRLLKHLKYAHGPRTKGHYLCSECNGIFFTRLDCEKHLKEKHSIDKKSTHTSEISSFVCKICQKCFSKKSACDKHFESHKNVPE